MGLNTAGGLIGSHSHAYSHSTHRCVHCGIYSATFHGPVDDHDHEAKHSLTKDAAGRWWETFSDSPGCTYVYLDGPPDETDETDDTGRAVRTVELGCGVNVDYDAAGKAIGIEFT